MGLIKAAQGAISGTLADQWREYFYCDTLPANILAIKARKRVTGRSANVKGDENIISTGSVVAVADGQCMIIVEQGKIIDVCSEPGEFIFDSGGTPSLFAGGDLGANALGSLKTVWERFKLGGQPGLDTRVYYFNTKEIIGNKYGTPNPIPFRVVDSNIGLDIDIAIRCFGEFSYKLTNPILFYTNVTGNITTAYVREMIDNQLRTELMTALQPAFSKVSAMGIRYSALPGHTQELAQALNDILSDQWQSLRGIEIVSLGVTSVSASKEDEDMIKNLQQKAVMRDPGMGAASIVDAQAEAMKSAASNEVTGPMFAFAGMNMAANTGGMNAQNLYTMQQNNNSNDTAWDCSCGHDGITSKFCTKCGFPKQENVIAPIKGDSWKCSCSDEVITGKFCAKCGKPKPEQELINGWKCFCGENIASGKFCSECGKPRPEEPTNKCTECGWESPDSSKPPKFCSDCGSTINSN